MSAPETFKGRKESYVIVTDKNGDEYLCPKSSLKRTKDLTKEELAECVEDARTGGPSSVGG